MASYRIYKKCNELVEVQKSKQNEFVNKYIGCKYPKNDNIGKTAIYRIRYGNNGKR